MMGELGGNYSSLGNRSLVNQSIDYSGGKAERF